MLASCTSAPTSPPPQIIYVGCPLVSPCPIPGSQPKNNGDLSADVRQLEAALLTCGLQVDTIKQCQETQRVKTHSTATTAD
ncbi:Rz1-like lysis system protein LysC [Ewingella americana]|uniref:Rz1-like lysis system protein LysC n=1 Tax=Ewingella americana TaxID=41202 RepID=UPI001F501A44|nr:Rz1-like lysis system protein LysC [Ewingella americana]